MNRFEIIFPSLSSGSRALLSGLVLACLLAVCITFTFLRYPLVSSDLMLYKLTQDIALHGGNPYDPKLVSAARLQLTGEVSKAPLMVWNPPPFLLFPGALLSFSPELLYSLWPLVIFISALSLALVGWSFAGRPRVSIPLILTAAWCCAPMVMELVFSQLSSLVSVLPILGVFLFISGRDLRGGMLCCFAILKPHVLLLPLASVAFWVISGRRWRFVVGLIVGTAALWISAELLFPGASSAWLHRERWPFSDVVGSTWPSLLSASWSSYWGLQRPHVLFLMSGLGLLSLFLGLNRFARLPRAEPIMATLVCNQFFSPYGFMFDQVVIVVVQAFIISRAVAAGVGCTWAYVIVLANLVSLAPLFMDSAGRYNLWWISYPITMALVYFLFLCFQSRGSSEWSKQAHPVAS